MFFLKYNVILKLMFSIVIPIYDEEKNLEILLNEINSNLIDFDKYEIILIDDFSKDNSLKVLEKFKNNDNILILRNNENKGQSYSIHKGIKEASHNTIVTIDADGQNNPADIPKLIKAYNLDNELYLVQELHFPQESSFNLSAQLR